MSSVPGWLNPGPDSQANLGTAHSFSQQEEPLSWREVEAADKKELSAFDEPIRFEWSQLGGEIASLERSVQAVDEVVQGDKVEEFTANMATLKLIKNMKATRAFMPSSSVGSTTQMLAIAEFPDEGP